MSLNARLDALGATKEWGSETTLGEIVCVLRNGVSLSEPEESGSELEECSAAEDASPLGSCVSAGGR